MQTVVNNIIESINFKNKEAFSKLLKECIYQYISDNERDREREELRDYKSVVLKLDFFFKNFTPFLNEFGRDKKLESGVEALNCVCQELGINIDKSECFLLFHMRDLGKFKIKESKLLEQIKKLWKQYPEYALDDQDFSAGLRNLRNERLIEYRKGNMLVKPTVIIRYRNSG